MNRNNGSVIQFLPLKKGQLNKGAGIYEVQSLIYADGDTPLVIKVQFEPTVWESYTIPKGEFRSFRGNVEVVSGLMSYD